MNEPNLVPSNYECLIDLVLQLCYLVASMVICRFLGKKFSSRFSCGFHDPVSLRLDKCLKSANRPYGN